MPKVSVYIRNHQTREYEPADAKTTYPLGTIFCLRYKKDGNSVSALNRWHHASAAFLFHSTQVVFKTAKRMRVRYSRGSRMPLSVTKFGQVPSRMTT